MQTFAVFFALAFLGGWRGLAAIVLYVAIGAIGLPVFSGFSGGIGHLLGPTGGYIFGFAVGGLVFALLERLPVRGRFWLPTRLFISLIPCYAVGTLWFCITYGAGAGIGVWAALTKCVLPFIIPDIVKLVLAWLIAEKTAVALGKTKDRG